MNRIHWTHDGTLRYSAVGDGWEANVAHHPIHGWQAVVGNTHTRRLTQLHPADRGWSTAAGAKRIVCRFVDSHLV